jgi:hypothetical protein
VAGAFTGWFILIVTLLWSADGKLSTKSHMKAFSRHALAAERAQRAAPLLLGWLAPS